MVLELPRAKEACPHGLAPTTSTTMQLALGDCLAIALLENKGFTAHDFSVFHPGGSLGASLKFVADIMHTGERLPLVAEDKVMSEAIVIMTQKSFGCLGVVDAKGRLVGMIIPTSRPLASTRLVKAAETLLRHDDDRLGHDLVFRNQRQAFSPLCVDVGNENLNLAFLARWNKRS